MSDRSSRPYLAFDNLTVLAKGGHVVFSGRNSESTPYFEAQGYPLPSEWFSKSFLFYSRASRVNKKLISFSVHFEDPAE